MQGSAVLSCEGVSIVRGVPVKACTLLQKAQAVWDGVPKLENKLSRADFVRYAKPYCGHRERLEKARAGAVVRRELH